MNIFHPPPKNNVLADKKLDKKKIGIVSHARHDDNSEDHLSYFLKKVFKKLIV